MGTNNLRVLLVAENASLQFGGESALPLHYFRVLRQRGIETWLVVHERTRPELESIFADNLDRLYFISDTQAHILLWHLGKALPQRIANFTTGLGLRLLTQWMQRQIIKNVIQKQQINIIHQPIPVSPKDPSMIYGLGVPVIIGPMNGGMKYPPAFDYLESQFVKLSIEVGRLFANVFNCLIPGKLKATKLLVANSRTESALPKGIQGEVIELVENGVDLSIWRPPLLEDCLGVDRGNAQICFAFIGRLVDWKAADILLIAFKEVVTKIPTQLDIIGDGVERANLEAQVQRLGLEKQVNFCGWLSQQECAQKLQAVNVLVLPSLLECGGAVVLEAMAMGLPVIATKWGGPADYLDETCGILVEPISRKEFSQNLAMAMLTLAQQPELCQKMGIAGRKRIEEEFNWDVKVEQILQIYKKAQEDFFK